MKKSQLASLLENDEASDQMVENPISLKRLFHGWLREMSAHQPRPIPDLDDGSGIRRVLPAVQSSVPADLRNATAPQFKWKILTIREVLGLTRATVRESVEHRTWPPEVILKFMAAEVVTRKDRRR
jgi:hypothetical protein